MCQRVMATLQCSLLKCEHFIEFFLPHPNFAHLRPNITWLREATHSELLHMKRVKKVSCQVIDIEDYFFGECWTGDPKTNISIPALGTRKLEFL